MGLRTRIASGAVAAALVIAVPFIASKEGKENDPYLDLAKIPTVCFGETRVEMRRYSDQECMAMLSKATEGFMYSVIDCTPGLTNRPYQLAAATSLAYNIGSSAYCRSTVARRFNAGDFKSACAGFGAWVYAKGKKVQGLVNRRAAETKLCLTGL